MADAPAAHPRPVCGRAAYGHTCHRERGHRGGHRCTCGASYATDPTHRIPHHDLITMTFPESDAA